jgi:hypothetical protein
VWISDETQEYGQLVVQPQPQLSSAEVVVNIQPKAEENKAAAEPHIESTKFLFAFVLSISAIEWLAHTHIYIR